MAGYGTPARCGMSRLSKAFKQLLPFLLSAALIILLTLAATHLWPSAFWLYTLSLLSAAGVLLILA